MNNIKELTDEELEKVSGGNETGNASCIVGQHICVNNSLLVEITMIDEGGPSGVIMYSSVVTGYDLNCSESMKKNFPIGKVYNFFESNISYTID